MSSAAPSCDTKASSYSPTSTTTSNSHGGSSPIVDRFADRLRHLLRRRVGRSGAEVRHGRFGGATLVAHRYTLRDRPFQARFRPERAGYDLGMRRIVNIALAGIATVGLIGCASDGSNDVNPDDVDVTDDDAGFDPDVSDGVGTETDEGRNQGFEEDEPSGNVEGVGG